ncbi:MAG: segregation/condensation protein A [Armatimonadota bacterium]
MTINIPKTSYKVKIDLFEGPLDLLLYLVDKSQLDICAISLAEIADEYLQYLNLMQVLNLEVESSYLVIFATLLEIKSRALLPIEKNKENQYEYADEDEAATELINKLKKYKKYKEAALYLSEKEKWAASSYSRNRDFYDTDPEHQHYAEASIYDLITAFNRVLNNYYDRLEKDKDIQIEKIRINVPQRMEQIYERISRLEQLSFSRLFEDAPDKEMLIVTFLAVLELSRLQKISLVQGSLESEIIILKN